MYENIKLLQLWSGSDNEFALEMYQIKKVLYERPGAQ